MNLIYLPLFYSIIFFFFFFFFLVTIAFKPKASARDGCSYHQAKTPIDFWCKRDLNSGPLLDDKRLYQLSKLEPTINKLIKIVKLESGKQS